jgi:hypothetical protein
VDRIGLVEVISTLRTELTAALEQADGEELRFPVEGMQVQLHVGVTQDRAARSGLRFWVVELGTDAHVVHEQVQRVTVTLGAPQREGDTVAVRDEIDLRP